MWRKSRRCARSGQEVLRIMVPSFGRVISAVSADYVLRGRIQSPGSPELLWNQWTRREEQGPAMSSRKARGDWSASRRLSKCDRAAMPDRLGVRWTGAGTRVRPDRNYRNLVRHASTHGLPSAPPRRGRRKLALTTRARYCDTRSPIIQARRGKTTVGTDGD
jgi:hypothetical protein